MCVQNMFFRFVFNDPATTETYTYCHPRSRPDALQIAGAVSGQAGSLRQDGRARPMAVRFTGYLATAALSPGLDSVGTTGLRPATPWCVATWRSEEHTSELQSLMRLSYAVFWLKKNIYTVNSSIERNTTTYNEYT